MRTARARIRSSSRTGTRSFFSGRITLTISAFIGRSFARDRRVSRRIRRLAGLRSCVALHREAAAGTGAAYSAHSLPLAHGQRQPGGNSRRETVRERGRAPRAGGAWRTHRPAGRGGCHARKTRNRIVSFMRCRSRRRLSPSLSRRAIAWNCWSAASRASGRGPIIARSKSSSSITARSKKRRLRFFRRAEREKSDPRSR